LSQIRWTISLKIYRKRENQPACYQKFEIDADPDEFILDLVERVWAKQDRSLTFRHACHHSTCGACGMLVNGKEKLTCITPVRSVTRDGGEIKLEPLRNFPVISDLVVDMGPFFRKMSEVNFCQVAPLKDACLPYERKSQPEGPYERLVDCIECGMCISACPAAATNFAYLGPAVLAAAQQTYRTTRQDQCIALSDNRDGVWRCHSAFECSEVCPSFVDPGWRIMDLRRMIIAKIVADFFRVKPKDDAYAK
jgi:succinate dehydrogenase / fumarate reductase iron-sulfur subunit